MATLAALEQHRIQAEFGAGRNASVTAIIPTFHRPQLVRRAILSALNQTYRQLEVILVIDGRDDQTRELVAAMREPRLRVVTLSSSMGAAQARNIGVSLATSGWVAFLDDDDEWLPRKISMQMTAARASSAIYPVISSRTIVRTPAFDWISPEQPYTPGEPMSEYLFCRRHFVDGARYMQTSTLLTRRALMLDLPFQKHLKRHQDWDWLLRAAAHAGVDFQMLHEPLAIFHVDQGRTSVGRALDWEFSRAWAREMRPAFTPRAYSFFLATECISRAVKTNAGGVIYARLIWEFFARGQPTARSLLSLVGFLCLTERLRGWMRQSIRHLRSRSRTGQAVQSGLRAQPRRLLSKEKPASAWPFR
jgi:glycosyltransferase involved in cell wall biosynthesis